MKAVFTSLVEILAHCDDCGWTADSANAQGLASQHAEKHGHLVSVTVTRHFEYATSGRWHMTQTEARAQFPESV